MRAHVTLHDAFSVLLSSVMASPGQCHGGFYYKCVYMLTNKTN